MCAILSVIIPNVDPGQVRFGLISYRDHPPQEKTYVTQVHPFTEDLEVMSGSLALMNIVDGAGNGGKNRWESGKPWWVPDPESRYSHVIGGQSGVRKWD